MSKYFAFDPECGFELFDTAEEAQNYAQQAIDQYRDEASEGWPEPVEGICWGEVKQATFENTFNAGIEEYPDLEYTDYELKDI